MVLFLARDENMLVRCAVTCRALAGAATLHSLDKDKPLVVYRALKVRIQAIAREKYRRRLRDGTAWSSSAERTWEPYSSSG
jgi:Protein of unknown function (DUF1488)